MRIAEAILGRAVLVVEGASEAALFPEASTVLEKSLGSDSYMHLDFAGISLFNAESETSVPKYGPVFKALNKPAFAFYDEPNKPATPEATAKLADYVAHWQSPAKGVETLLICARASVEKACQIECSVEGAASGSGAENAGGENSDSP